MKLDHNLKTAIMISVGIISGMSIGGLVATYSVFAATGIFDSWPMYLFGIAGIIMGFFTFVLNISQIQSNNGVDKENGYRH